MARKIGEGHAAAMMRLGLKELRNAINPSRESVADQEIGVFGTQTQGEIADARDPEQQSRDRKVSLDDIRAYAKELSEAQGRAGVEGKEQAQDRDRDGHDM